MKKIIFVIVTLLSIFGSYTFASNETIDKAYHNKKSDLQVQGSGRVIKILSDDNNGRKHQRFLIKLPSKLTILIAHNIDLSNRISTLSVGDTIEFYGEYEWNQKGGVVHWTHHDPRGKHKDGWLKHEGIIYK